jgi:hypothetical protein
MIDFKYVQEDVKYDIVDCSLPKVLDSLNQKINYLKSIGVDPDEAYIHHYSDCDGLSMYLEYKLSLTAEELEKKKQEKINLDKKEKERLIAEFNRLKTILNY